MNMWKLKRIAEHTTFSQAESNTNELKERIRLLISGPAHIKSLMAFGFFVFADSNLFLSARKHILFPCSGSDFNELIDQNMS